MSNTNSRPFWDGPIEARIARLQHVLASPTDSDRDHDDTALRLALRVLEQLRAEKSSQLVRAS